MKYSNHVSQTQAKLGFRSHSWRYVQFFSASLLQRISNTLSSDSRKEIAPSTQVQAFQTSIFSSLMKAGSSDLEVKGSEGVAL